MDIETLYAEVITLMDSLEAGAAGEHLWTNYQDTVAISMRLQEIHNEIAYKEIVGEASTELKKFRTTIIDPCIERLDKLASFESRKITGMQMEWEMERKG